MGRGSSGIGKAKGSAGNAVPVGAERLIDKRVTETGITTSNVEEQLGLRDLMPEQKKTLVDVFREMGKNDYSFDANRTPYEIEQINISQPFLDGTLKRKDVYVYIVTNGNTGREYIDSMDTRYRRFYIGQKGGTYLITKTGKHRAVSGFDVYHGTRE